MAKTIPMLDLMFFLTETKNNPKHVAALMLFKRPDNAGSRYVAGLVAAYRKAIPVAPFNCVPEFSLLRMPRWVEARSLDMRYHVQHIALPEGATQDDLLDLIADLHPPLLDRNQPCFRLWFIEGLPDDTFAMFLKVHHAMVDGHSAIARIGASLDERPDGRDVRPFFTVDPGGGEARPGKARADALSALKTAAVKQAVALKSLYLNLARKGVGRRTAGADRGSAPFTAPRGPMNAPTLAARSLATLSLPIGEMKAVGKAFGGTLNDVAVTIVDAGLIGYLNDRGLLPREPLVAMCPLSLREAGDTEAATKISALFVPLGQPNAAIGARMDQVMRATQSAKDELRAMSKDAAMLYAILAFGLGEVVDAIGSGTVARPIANFVLSNVQGPRHDMYLRGSRMIGIFPLSTLGAGIGLNVTLLSYSTTMDFGFVGNGTSMPALDGLARHTHVAFAALKREAAKRHPAPSSAAKPPAPPAKSRAKPRRRRPSVKRGAVAAA